MEKLAMKQYSANIAKGKEIVEYFVNELKKEGITNVPLWTPTDVDVDVSKIKFKNDVTPEEKKKGQGDQFQLETDYIQRYLGELSPIQESSLVQLKKWVADLQKGKVSYDVYVTMEM